MSDTTVGFWGAELTHPYYELTEPQACRSCLGAWRTHCANAEPTTSATACSSPSLCATVA